MFAKARLKELDDIKRMTVLQADTYRSLLQLESAAICERLDSLRSVRAKVAANRPLLLVGATIAGVLALRHWQTLARWAPSVFAAWRWSRRLLGK
jgi:hypothetical protein